MLEDSLTALTISSNINNLLSRDRAKEGHTRNIFSNRDDRILTHCSSSAATFLPEEHRKIQRWNSLKSL